MHYVISDIHGCYEQYIEMLDKIAFSDSDILYVNGDVFDIGNDSISVIENMISQLNIIPIMGNHENRVIPLLESITYGTDEKIIKLAVEEALHQETSISIFNGLSRKKQEKILNYVKSFAYYKVLTINDIEYVITHAGFDYENFDENKPLDNYLWEDLVWAETDYSKTYYHNKILITGHNITGLIDKSYEGKILRRNNHIAIDCGCAYGGNLGCICLETGEEFYVTGVDIGY